MIEGIFKKVFGSLKLGLRLIGMALITIAYYLVPLKDRDFRFYCGVVVAVMLNYGIERLLEKKNGNTTTVNNNG